MINLRNSKEIIKIKKACEISAKALKLAGSLCKVGVNTLEIDDAVREYIFSQSAKPNFLNYRGFPNSCCISINEMVIHGIPSKKTVLKDGDIVSIDVGAEYEGYNGDNAYTFVVGKVSQEVEKFLKVSEESLYEGIKKAVVGNRIGDISEAVEIKLKSFGYGIIREFVGHGVGENLHEEPEIPNYLMNKNAKGPRLLPGMVIAIEPMTTQKSEKIVKCKDGWGIKTENKDLAAHYEHTILITEKEPIILTEV